MPEIRAPSSSRRPRRAASTRPLPSSGADVLAVMCGERAPHRRGGTQGGDVPMSWYDQPQSLTVPVRRPATLVVRRAAGPAADAVRLQPGRRARAAPRRTTTVRAGPTSPCIRRSDEAAYARGCPRDRHQRPRTSGRPAAPAASAASASLRSRGTEHAAEAMASFSEGGLHHARRAALQAEPVADFMRWSGRFRLATSSVARAG